MFPYYADVKDIALFVQAIILLRTTIIIILRRVLADDVLLHYCHNVHYIHNIRAYSAPRSCTTGVRVCDRGILVTVKNDRVGINILRVILHAYLHIILLILLLLYRCEAGGESMTIG